ncbi:MAG TPA: DUF2950 domain-containing protein [Acetobacteraceae bacterium]|nr:DUF2950 domain-containing protein [Acetobacteraceae bacterium]
MARKASLVAMAALLSLGSAWAATSAEVQRTFATAEEASAALASAARSHDETTLHAIFGPDGGRLLSSGDPRADKEEQRRFAAAYDEKHVLDQEGTNREVVVVGNNDWPLPIPLVQSGGRWRFDTKEGAEEIINRRIGSDELAAIRVALAYVDAQKVYFAHKKSETGTGTYSERLISTPGHQDGLYWPAAGGAESPFAKLVAQAEEEGYRGAFNGKHIPYQGYYFRVLQAQGPEAPGGARSYVNSGRMSEGFALVAWPAGYGSSGIMTFQVSDDGVVFQKDLGSDTARLAANITRFDPGLTWARIEVTDQ